MIYYVVEENPDDRVIEKGVSIIKGGGVIAFPTDSNWVMGADINSKSGVEKLYRIKKVDKKRHLSLICNSISMANRFSQISNSVYRQIKGVVPGAYTFILPPSKSLPRIIRDYKKEKEIGIRIPNSVICTKLIEALDGAIISASITCKTLGFDDDNSCLSSSEIQLYSYQIEDGLDHLIPLIIDPGEFQLKGESSIIDFSASDIPILIREGAGSLAPFNFI
jgi:tRNA threonylcarbamoyl adenosine modification protein (Sua5/YciO/YrdC/YwlC family)